MKTTKTIFICRENFAIWARRSIQLDFEVARKAFSPPPRFAGFGGPMGVHVFGKLKLLEIALLSAVLAASLAAAADLPAQLVAIPVPGGPPGGSSGSQSGGFDASVDNVIIDDNTLGCFNWNKGTSTTTPCNTGTQGTRSWYQIGVWYCPPPNQHQACDNNGSPTTGTVDSAPTRGGSSVGFWCVQFSNGQKVDECNATQSSIFVDRVKGGSTFGQTITGTFGGLVNTA